MLRAGSAKVKAMDMRNFFGQPITKARHVANSAITHLNDLEKLEKESQDMKARKESQFEDIGNISDSDSDEDISDIEGDGEQF